MAANVAVAQAQKSLNALGFNAGAVDGIWGPNTKTAVVNFRAAAGLNPVPAGPEAPAKYLDAAFLDAVNIAAFKKGVKLTSATEVPTTPVKAGPLAPPQPVSVAMPAAPGFSMPAILDKLKSPWVLGGAAAAILLGALIVRARRLPSTQPQGAVAGLLGRRRKAIKEFVACRYVYHTGEKGIRVATDMEGLPPSCKHPIITVHAATKKEATALARKQLA